ncbi:hypothetical protein F5J12DRAFT_833165 [Pisolithus orientalis]|uniref:uncharacterized protein n=1 Tax=Pisolithus orientalis TaxID=936130 RepID=UPI0022256FB1|nr:uncharacterized protein F5J12DRAFT_833165 [Pisolithus orientalis]KAI6006235.1 hypothetical protein F5J12DRAFT_833165 [Pisolithus orientalis]
MSMWGRGNVICICGLRTVFASQRVTKPSTNGRSTEWHMNDYGMGIDSGPIRLSCKFYTGGSATSMAISWSHPQREG